MMIRSTIRFSFVVLESGFVQDDGAVIIDKLLVSDHEIISIVQRLIPYATALSVKQTLSVS